MFVGLLEKLRRNKGNIITLLVAVAIFFGGVFYYRVEIASAVWYRFHIFPQISLYLTNDSVLAVSAGNYYFNEFKDYSLNILVIYWFHPPKFFKASAFTQKVNMEILKRFNAEGIEFALPSTTTRFAPGRGKPPVPYRTNDARQPERQPPDAEPDGGPAPLD